MFAALVAGPSVALADWSFTRWGMTPQQVVDASGGTAHLLAPAERTRSDDWEVSVKGSIHEAGLTLQGGYMFDTRRGGLICVLYNAVGDNVGKLRDSLIARYGRPNDNTFGPLQDLTWQTPDEIELAIDQTRLTAAVTHCAPGR